MPEAVRLVVWDLDETFWKGTVTEGGIREYVAAHHDMVITLARRGILSTICSKNDEAPILQLLEAHGIREYFVFPSISWAPKGPRLAALIEEIQLRPASVMFIDDNPNNRAEAAAMIPGLQVENEHFLPSLLDDPRFRGKDDSGLTRLAQYKLMETRRRAQTTAEGGNEAFLRSCDIRIAIEYDVAAHADRAIELINRTNQLNYTKRRLPDDPHAARAAFAREIEAAHLRQSGLVRVVDKYGDYGFVGFFQTENERAEYVAGEAYRSLRHFCFSCRTLGMLVEQWVYEYLGRPQLRVEGDVLTDLSVPHNIDWIRLVPSLGADAVAFEQVAPHMVVVGGCETNAISVYLSPYAGRLEMMGNFRAGGLFVRLNSASGALSTINRTRADFAAEAAALELPVEPMAGDYFADAPAGTVFIINPSLDGPGERRRYRHKTRGWELTITPLGGQGSGRVDFNESSDAEVLQVIGARGRLKAARDHVLRAAAHIRANYDSIYGMSMAEKQQNIRDLADRVPPGCKIVFLLNHHAMRRQNGELGTYDGMKIYAEMIRAVAAEYPYLGAVSFTETIEDDSQILVGGNHYERLVYLRTAERLVEKVRALEIKK